LSSALFEDAWGLVAAEASELAPMTMPEIAAAIRVDFMIEIPFFHRDWQ
jgi:hypothetical protein